MKPIEKSKHPDSKGAWELLYQYTYEEMHPFHICQYLLQRSAEKGNPSAKLAYSIFSRHQPIFKKFINEILTNDKNRTNNQNSKAVPK